MALAPSELETCVLATIRQHQPCSTYAVRQAFARSSTPDWSGSTGSIYPLVERLLRLGLIEAEAEVGDPRGRRDLKVTPDGERAVLAWLTALDPAIAKATPDPIRTRISFLDQLPSDAERVAFLKQADALTRTALDELGPMVEAAKATGVGEYLAGRGAIRQLEARGEWLGEAIAVYDKTADPTAAP